MFAIFMEESLVSTLMAVFLLLGIGSRTLLGLLYQNMIRETDNMSATNNKLLKQCKLKFANCYQLNNGVNNIPVFVERFLNRLSLGGISFDGLYHLSGQSVLLSMICAGVGICRSIFKGKMLGEILPFYIVSFFGLYLYFSISAIVDVKGKRQVLKINLVDFLENHLSARIDATAENMDRLYGQAAGRNLRVMGTSRGSGRRSVELLPIDGGLPGRSLRREMTVSDDEAYGSAKQGIPEKEFAEMTKEPTAKNILEQEELETLLQEFLAT